MTQDQIIGSAAMPDTSTIALVAGSSVIAAALTQGTSVVRDWLKRRRDAAYSALYAALTLEEYARQCSSYVSDSETYEASSHAAGAPRARLPDKPVFADSIDWNALGVETTTDCLSLLVEIDMADQKIAAEFEYVDDDAGVAEMRRSTVDIGLRAYALAASLRKARGVEALKLDPEWNFVIYLSERKQHYIELAEKRAERNAKLLKDMAQGQVAGTPDGAEP